ncbi:MAG TPA: hypothetical protein VLE27_03170 [Thermoanaerobaculia bacterium]|nr:hypothetical protein [Thermoanaerobaculia bacterium]
MIGLLEPVEHGGIAFFLGLIVIHHDHAPGIFGLVLKEDLEGVDES